MQGKIISNISNLYYIEANEKIYTCNARGKLKDEGIVVGDIVDFDENENIIEKIEERDNYIKRPKISNITQIVCVLSAKNPKPDLLMLDKQLAYAEYVGIKAAIVINKIDLDKEKVEEIKEIYKNIGYPMVETNAKEKEGIASLNKILENNISVFAGNSGVGKSTLLNSIFGKELTKSGLISNKNKKGKNTTTNIALYKIKKNEYIADTPGFSTFDISEIESDKLAEYFKEFKPLLDDCEFVGCTHIKEENCGIKQALQQGKIDNGRYERFCKIYEELKERGLIAQITDEDEVRELINNGKAVFYIGFDPTADSLHVGHFMALCLMKRLQMAGNKPIALIGGGTGMIGDPSGKTDMRKMLTPEIIQHNCDCFKKQMSKFIDFSDGKALMVNNADWLLDLNYVELLRDVGACFSVNNMLRAECYKQRMEKGLSFLEFNYMIMQSYDFYALYQKYGCNMQFGGDDQWSNMLGGTELIRRKLGKNAYAMTINLLLNSEGKKMGKTQKGAVWLDPEKTTPFEFFQYWRNIDDADVMKCLRMLTFLPLEEINAMEGWEGSQLNKAKEILAYELTKLVHGEDEANKAQDAARALFGGGADSADMPSTSLSADDFADGKISVIDILVKAGLAKSKSEARRLIEQGGVSVNDEKIKSLDFSLSADEIAADPAIIKKGKKIFHKIVMA